MLRVVCRRCVWPRAPPPRSRATAALRFKLPLASPRHSSTVPQPLPPGTSSNDEGPVSSPAESSASWDGGEPNLLETTTNASVGADWIGADAAEAAAAQLSLWWPHHDVMLLVDAFHQFTGLPYWQSTIALTVVLRALIAPLTVFTMRTQPKMLAMKPEMELINQKYQTHPRKGDPEVGVAYRAEVAELFKKYDYHPLSALAAPMIQIPLFMSLFFGLQHMGTYFPGWSCGGAFWFTNLSVPDSTYVLPALTGVTMLMVVELATDLRAMAAENPQKARLFKTFMRVMAVAAIPFTSTLPQGLFFYWLPSNVFTIVQSSILKVHAVRRALRIPDLPKPSPASPGGKEFLATMMADVERKSRRQHEELKAQHKK